MIEIEREGGWKRAWLARWLWRSGLLLVAICAMLSLQQSEPSSASLSTRGLTLHLVGE